jgi:hypothetical protein
MYKLLKDNVTNEVCAILKDGSTSIPICDDNTDYQAYLKWVALGNQPTPAENE